jgi:hypothetical protein
MQKREKRDCAYRSNIKEGRDEKMRVFFIRSNDLELINSSRWGMNV